MKLNLGSGDKYRDGWINVDLYAGKADTRKDIREVAYPPESVSRIICIHTIEHITKDEGVALINRCYAWLKTGGKLEIETPNRLRCKELILAGKALKGAKGLMGGRSVDKVGWHRWLKKWATNGRTAEIPDKWNLPGEEHKYVWDGLELLHLMEAVGFVCLTRTPKYHGHRADRDMRIVGVKP